MDFKLSKKNGGEKWWTWGNFRKNKWGNYQASFKVTPEFKKLINDVPDGEYINFSAFEDKKEVDSHNEAKGNAYQPQQSYADMDSEVPF